MTTPRTRLRTPEDAVREALEDEVGRLRELAQHLRSCVECGETDVMTCHLGRPLWVACFGEDAHLSDHA